MPQARTKTYPVDNLCIGFPTKNTQIQTSGERSTFECFVRLQRRLSAHLPPSFARALGSSSPKTTERAPAEVIKNFDVGDFDTNVCRFGNPIDDPEDCREAPDPECL